MSLPALILAALLLNPGAPPGLSPSSGGDPLTEAMERLSTDPLGARRTLEALAAAGDPEAMNILAAVIEQDTIDWPAEPERSRDLLERAAAGGSDGARINLAVRLLHEDDPAGYTRAIEMLRLAERTEASRPLTHHGLGYAYMFGRGVEQDLRLGSGHMRQAVQVDPGNMEAQFLLARAYQNGWGIAPDPDLAYRHMRIAADAGDERAQWHVGMMLLEGEGTAPDAVEAYRFVRASGEAGFSQGMVSTAVMLALGQGVAEDDPQARRWYQAAAEQGSAHALRGLGAMLLTGEGGGAEPERGVAYLELAREAGEENAAAILIQITIPNDRALRARLDRLKSDWIERHGRPLPAGT